jgi:hypothetical protein
MLVFQISFLSILTNKAGVGCFGFAAGGFS